MVVVTNVLLKPTFVSIFANQIEILIFYMVPILKLSQLHGSQKKILAIPCSPLEFSKLNDLTYFLSSIYSTNLNHTELTYGLCPLLCCLLQFVLAMSTTCTLYVLLF